MWRTKAVVSMLVEEVAELRMAGLPDHPADGEGPEVIADRPEMEALLKARRRAILVGLVDWIALVVLLVFHSRSASFLSFGPSVDTVFTLGALAVAMHSGFRLGQARTYKVVSRLCQDLWERQGD